MEESSLKSRAIIFAICAGAVAFILALVATAEPLLTAENAARALIVSIVCAAMCWAAAERALSATAAAIDVAIERLALAGKGDLHSPIRPEVREHAPRLADAMEGLFHQFDANLESVHRLAMFDPVTGLSNRTHFYRTCERILSELEAGRGAALFFIDLDRFKAVNDTMGHAMGDLLLGMVADRLQDVADRFSAEGQALSPLIGRLAGDEFTMFFPELAEESAAESIGDSILHALSQPFLLGEQEIVVGASVGIALRPQHGLMLQDLMRAADAAMYHAKAQGRGRAEHFTEMLAAEIAERARLESDLRVAIDKDQFSLVFQPQLSAADGRLVAAEALLRWRHPEGLKLPAAFIQCAEDTGLIIEIGEWVVASVAETISRWGKLGIKQRMAVNISPRQLDHAAFFRRLREAMHLAEAPAELLELEITETLAMRCSDDVIDAIRALRADGASLAIDDFGTGYSNLARLRELPVNRVKLDRCLIEKVADNAEARTIAQALIGLIHGLNCEAVAEGIETHAQAEVLRVIGCDILQGYAMAEPMAEDAFLVWARSGNEKRRSRNRVL